MIDLEHNQELADRLDALTASLFSQCSEDDQVARAVQQTIQRVGDKWSVLTIALLQDGPKRFSELRRGIAGISQRMLSRTLRALERDGLVTRTVYPEIPPRVVYELTDLGHTLIVPALTIAEWALRNAALMEENRARFDAEHGDPDDHPDGSR